LKVYRFVGTRYPDGISPEGARRNGGRWNSKGVAVVYCATSVSLAMLELRVHSPHPHPGTRLKFVIEVPDDAIIQAPLDQLPRGWNTLPPGATSKRYGDTWVAANTSLGLLVPSVIPPEENNLILNPAHARFKEVRIVSRQPIELDTRLYATPRKKR
jgi:RES domain-containing protein